MHTRLIFTLIALLCSLSQTVQGQTRYNLEKMQRERLGRGVMAVRTDEARVLVSWRYLSFDPKETAFNVYRNNTLLTRKPIGNVTYFLDENRQDEPAEYEVRPVLKGRERREYGASFTLPAQAPIGYLNIPITPPAPQTMPDGSTCTYSANDASIGDLNGDGQYEIVLKWEPSNAHDNSHDGFTGSVFIDAYTLTGTQLWRINLGKNIRAGAHYTQFMVFDLDGDGRAEVAMKTADGTMDGEGVCIGDPEVDYRTGISATADEAEGNPTNGARSPKRKNDTNIWNWQETFNHIDDSLERTNENDRNRNRLTRRPGKGRILEGPEYLTIFDGETGRALCTTDYAPARGDVKAWGDSYANRSDRYLACVAYLDGIRPSLVMCRGYYTRTVLAAFDWDGHTLSQRWVFDSNTPGNEAYAGQGNHNLRVADVDGDGCDEITYGACCIDHNGHGLYSTGMGHGDALHLTSFYPNNNALQVWDCHENKRDGSELRDARTGKIIWQKKANFDVGRCMAADIDPTNAGLEMWSSNTGGICNTKGEIVNAHPNRLPCNMAVWWDGDLSRELLDRNSVSKYNWRTGACETLQTFDGCAFNNGTKSNPCLQADIVGDWREEVLVRTSDNMALRLYISTLPTSYRFHTFLEDPVYRISIATQNVAYNQPTQVGFYFGTDLKKGTTFRGTKIK